MSTNALPELADLSASETKRLAANTDTCCRLIEELHAISVSFLEFSDSLDDIRTSGRKVKKEEVEKIEADRDEQAGKWASKIKTLTASLGKMAPLVAVPAVLHWFAHAGPDGAGLGWHSFPRETWRAHRDERYNCAREELARLRRAIEEQQDEAPDEAEQYVTLDQAAAMVNRGKKHLERCMNKQGSNAPPPDVEGGGGRAHEWRWSVLRPWLEKTFGKKLPKHFPSLRPMS
jgi:hypothetical protein